MVRREGALAVSADTPVQGVVVMLVGLQGVKELTAPGDVTPKLCHADGTHETEASGSMILGQPTPSTLFRLLLTLELERFPTFRRRCPADTGACVCHRPV